jgi:hypothetical protein
MKPSHWTVLLLCSVALGALLANKSAHAEPDQFFGILLSLDTHNLSLQIRDPRSGAFFTASFTDQTTFTDGEEELALKDVPVGAPVIVDYIRENNQNTVHLIVVRKDLLKEGS